MFRARILYTGVNGSKSVSVSKVVCRKTPWGRPMQYFAVTGEDKRNANTVFLPPTCSTKENAMHVAMRWLLAFSL